MDKLNILEIKNLSIHFKLKEGTLRAIENISYNIPTHSTVGVVGESGSGKSVTAQSILGILPSSACIPQGEILFTDPSGKIIDLAKENPDGKYYNAMRGKYISYIFQEPMSAFSPIHTIGSQMIECLRLHTKMDKKEARERAIEMLNKVGISNPEKRIDQYSFEMSGGMRQRAMIAICLSTNPSLVIADEPTTSLDVTIQAQILNLLRDMQDELGISIMFITHNLGVVAQVTDYIQVMYLGNIMEAGSVDEIFYEPRHPYTVNLLKAIPKIGKNKGKRLVSIPGQIPGPFDRIIDSCQFYTRCPDYMDGLCNKKAPDNIQLSDTHFVKCWKYAENLESR